ncbi:related to nadh-ubiquinone oxidoreductase subunit b17.2 [Fusarium mangiferae]|uniref:NADH dehydrogenase [ubiquinone] 1 alpha subcomplex subunit n=1 Tax=Fusarium mangiferae TaxID=192010 RepID=A0A1L7U0J4_FUSMA|nr:uncharacterized protein FMAN_09994 [Fusarium mangiferae]CVL00616.1 related to nadh-ubiquinone oxidoreductase subunit b17.2 [Fusarium mangiferae]
MSTISRTLSNLRKVGIKMLYIGDTKAGRLIGTDRAGNKFFENNEELPLRTRWVEYAKHDYDAAHIEPGWHAWISYSVDKPPTEDPLLQAGVRAFEPSRALPNFTQTRGAFKTYNTYVSHFVGGKILTVLVPSPRSRHGSLWRRLGHEEWSNVYKFA